MLIDPWAAMASVPYLCWLLWQLRGMRMREAYRNRPCCPVCGLAEEETDLDIYYRCGFTHEGGTAYAEPGSEIYERRKAAHTHEIRRAA